MTNITPARNRRARALALATAAGIAASLLASCSSGATPEASADAATHPLYQDARAEGSLTWYTSVDTQTAEATADAFEEAYPGIRVNLQRLTTGQITARYAEERTAGASPADVVTVGDPVFYETAAAEGWFETELDLPSLEHWPADYYADGVALVSLIPLGVTYNSNTVTAPPETWEDVLDPAYEGKLQLGDPRNIPAYMQLYSLLLEEYGEDFLERLEAQSPTIYPSIVNATQTVASGGAALSMPGTNPTTQVVRAEGAPLGFVALSPTVGVEFSSAVATGSEHPAAGALFTDFLLSEYGQETLNVNAVSPLGELPGTEAMPADYQRIPSASLGDRVALIVKELGIE